MLKSPSSAFISAISSEAFVAASFWAFSNAVISIGYVGGSRYVRVTADFTGSHSTGTAVAATVVKGHPRHNTDADSSSTV